MNEEEDKLKDESRHKLDADSGQKHRRRHHREKRERDRERVAVRLGWHHEWFDAASEETVKVHEVVRGPFCRPQLVRHCPYVRAAQGSDDCLEQRPARLPELRRPEDPTSGDPEPRAVVLKSGIPDPWTEYLAFRRVGRVCDDVDPREVGLLADRLLLTETVWRRWGLSMGPGIPDPWRAWPKSRQWDDRPLKESLWPLYGKMQPPPQPQCSCSPTCSNPCGLPCPATAAKPTACFVNSSRQPENEAPLLNADPSAEQRHHSVEETRPGQCCCLGAKRTTEQKVPPPPPSPPPPPPPPPPPLGSCSRCHLHTRDHTREKTCRRRHRRCARERPIRCKCAPQNADCSQKSHHCTVNSTKEHKSASHNMAKQKRPRAAQEGRARTPKRCCSCCCYCKNKRKGRKKCVSKRPGPDNIGKCRCKTQAKTQSDMMPKKQANTQPDTMQQKQIQKQIDTLQKIRAIEYLSARPPSTPAEPVAGEACTCTCFCPLHRDSPQGYTPPNLSARPCPDRPMCGKRLGPLVSNSCLLHFPRQQPLPACESKCQERQAAASAKTVVPGDGDGHPGSRQKIAGSCRDVAATPITKPHTQHACMCADDAKARRGRVRAPASTKPVECACYAHAPRHTTSVGRSQKENSGFPRCCCGCDNSLTVKKLKEKVASCCSKDTCTPRERRRSLRESADYIACGERNAGCTCKHFTGKPATNGQRNRVDNQPSVTLSVERTVLEQHAPSREKCRDHRMCAPPRIEEEQTKTERAQVKSSADKGRRKSSDVPHKSDSGTKADISASPSHMNITHLPVTSNTFLVNMEPSLKVLRCPDKKEAFNTKETIVLRRGRRTSRSNVSTTSKPSVDRRGELTTDDVGVDLQELYTLSKRAQNNNMEVNRRATGRRHSRSQHSTSRRGRGTLRDRTQVVVEVPEQEAKAGSLSPGAPPAHINISILFPEGSLRSAPERPNCVQHSPGASSESVCSQSCHPDSPAAGDNRLLSSAEKCYSQKSTSVASCAVSQSNAAAALDNKRCRWVDGSKVKFSVTTSGTRPELDLAQEMEELKKILTSAIPRHSCGELSVDNVTEKITYIKSLPDVMSKPASKVDNEMICMNSSNVQRAPDQRLSNGVSTLLAITGMSQGASSFTCDSDNQSQTCSCNEASHQDTCHPTVLHGSHGTQKAEDKERMAAAAATTTTTTSTTTTTGYTSTTVTSNTMAVKRTVSQDFSSSSSSSVADPRSRKKNDAGQKQEKKKQTRRSTREVVVEHARPQFIPISRSSKFTFTTNSPAEPEARLAAAAIPPSHISPTSSSEQVLVDHFPNSN